MSDEARTIAEQLDAAQSGEEFGRVLLDFMAAVDKESRP